MILQTDVHFPYIRLRVTEDGKIYSNTRHAYTYRAHDDAKETIELACQIVDAATADPWTDKLEDRLNKWVMDEEQPKKGIS